MPRLKTPDVETALLIYYSHSEIGNAEIKQLFECSSPNTIVKLKNQVKVVMAEKNIHTWNPNCVSTKIAYEVWGIDINQLEDSRKALIRLGKYKKIG